MFWDNFEELCKKNGKAPSTVAREIGLSNGVTTRWRNGGVVPRNSILQKLADYFGVSVNELLTDEKEREAVAAREEFGEFIKACMGLTDDEIKEVRHYMEYLKTKRE